MLLQLESQTSDVKDVGLAGSLIYLFVSSGRGLPLLYENIAQFFPLPLSTKMGSEAFLQEFQGTFILRHLNQMYTHNHIDLNMYLINK